MDHAKTHSFCNLTVIDLCDSDPCSSDATCESIDGLILNCTCNDGFVGNGVGPNGCTMPPGTMPPGATPSESPSGGNSPSGNNSPTNTNSPSAGNSPSEPGAPISKAVSSSNKTRVGYAAVALLLASCLLV